jgi:uncharacterized membrane protein
MLLGLAAAIAPWSQAAGGAAVGIADIRPIIERRCVSCHSATPTYPAFPAAPAGVMLDNDRQIVAEAERIHRQTVVTKVIPIGNLTAMTDEERALLDAWYRGGAGKP